MNLTVSSLTANPPVETQGKKVLILTNKYDPETNPHRAEKTHVETHGNG